MIDCYGRWTYDSSEPEEKWCDLDRIAHWIEDQGYKPETSMENLVCMLAAHFECDLESVARDWPDPEYLIGDIAFFVECSGTLKDFDYVA